MLNYDSKDCFIDLTTLKSQSKISRSNKSVSRNIISLDEDSVNETHDIEDENDDGISFINKQMLISQAIDALTGARYQHISQNVLRRMVEDYCISHPDVTSVGVIVGHFYNRMLGNIENSNNNNDDDDDDDTVVDNNNDNNNDDNNGYRNHLNEIDVINLVDNSSQDDPRVIPVAAAPSRHQLSPSQQIKEIFPDADPKYILSLLSKGEPVQTIIQTMAEKGYEKEIININRSASDPESTPRDFSSDSWETSPGYRSSAIEALKASYPFLRVAELKAFFATKKHHYTHACEAIDLAIGPALTGLSSPVPRHASAHRMALLSRVTPLLVPLGLATKSSLDK